MVVSVSLGKKMSDDTFFQLKPPAGSAISSPSSSSWTQSYMRVALPEEQPLKEPEPEPEPPPPLTIEDLEGIWAETSRGIQTESDFSNDANLLAALEADVKLRRAPGALDAGRGSNHRGKKHAG